MLLDEPIFKESIAYLEFENTELSVLQNQLSNTLDNFAVGGNSIVKNHGFGLGFQLARFITVNGMNLPFNENEAVPVKRTLILDKVSHFTGTDTYFLYKDVIVTVDIEMSITIKDNLPRYYCNGSINFDGYLVEQTIDTREALKYVIH